MGRKSEKELPALAAQLRAFSSLSSSSRTSRPLQESPPPARYRLKPMSLIIARFLLSRLESLSALLQVFQIFRGRADVLPAFLRAVSSRCRVSSHLGAAKTGETVCFVPLRYRSTPQTPQTRRRSHHPCGVVLLSDHQYPWRKDPHLPSQPPSSATCRARTGLPPMPFVSGFRICSRRRETRPQIP